MKSENQITRSSFTGLVFIGVLMTGVLTIAGFLGEHFWPFDIASHFRAQYVTFLMVAGCIFLVKKRHKEFWFSGLATIINLACILPIYFNHPDAEPGNPKSYTALVLNLQYTNNNFDLVSDYLEEHKPDILLLVEFSYSWKKGLDSVLKKYPSRAIELRDSPFGIGIYSRLPMLKKEIIEFGKTDIPSLRLELDIDGNPLTLMGVHWMPPFGRIGSNMRNAQLKDMENLINSDPTGKIMVLGDINMTPWSPIFQKFESNTKLKNIRKGFGILATWPAKYRWFGIPLDHGFTSPNIMVKNIKTGFDVGSDHLPLLITFGFKK